MSQRTDIHRPSAPEFDPEAYEILGVLDLHPDDEDTSWSADYAEFEEIHKAAGSPKLAEGKRTDRCGHCGQAIRYAAFLHHRPTHTMITVGQDCLSNRFSGMTAAKFQELRKRAELNRERKTRNQRRTERVTALVVSCDCRLAVLDDREALNGLHNTFLDDLWFKLADRDLSEKQISAAVTAIERSEQRKAEREAERAASIPAPEGRTEVSGTVKAVKLHEGFYGTTEKATVRDDRGFTVWVTVPSSVWGLEAGDTVSFTATLERSDRDETFAFGKRPSKWEVIEER